ncbi:uncharacterized protein LOC103717740 isoform X2 [Phoenix dactylifera]|uniref:Uncharacterized protein LOC103717740 isoform X2 n=1 Tax=Phoenix dactylifera TaxID=42345 RepID=A0A8B8ZGL9_PHODC|nr:uncharacterized protein LOC103717740 isoform X2 [Phoenix dactylifera]
MGTKENGHERDDHLSDVEKEVKQDKEGEPDYDPARDSLSSQGEAQSNEDNKVKRVSRVPKKLMKKESAENRPCTSRGSTNRPESNKLQFKTLNNNPRKSQKPNGAASTTKNINNKKPENVKVPSRPSSDLSEETDDKTIEEVKEIDVLDEAPNGDQSVGTDEETVDMEENNLDDDRASTYQKIEEMEQRIEKLEEELREVAALEISLYSMVPEHGSSAHKVHTPARRLSRLYIHACKHLSQDKRATVAKNTVSGLVLIAKSCGNDVPRLTFWLSNTVVLREIISQTFGIASYVNPTMRAFDSNGVAKKDEGKSTPLKWKIIAGNKQGKSFGLMQQIDDWQETSTFTAALEKIESWIFSRIVESVWWQTLTPHMQSPVEEMYTTKGYGRLLGPALGDQQQGSFSVNLWKSAFHDAFTRLCPVRAGGHECGCLPVLARMIGNWSRWLTDLFGIDADDSIKDGQVAGEDDDRREGTPGSKSFCLLNELSDLLMLPKDMLLERVVRKEVCPSIDLPLITRILCNFTPDEFCPDPVPGIVLEELNSESLLERRLSDKDLASSFPRAAAPVVYSPPSPADVAEKVGDASGKAELDRKASMVQRKGYTSDEELYHLDSPLASIIDKTPPVSPILRDGTQKESKQANARYKLLREVWSV